MVNKDIMKELEGKEVKDDITSWDTKLGKQILKYYETDIIKAHNKIVEGLKKQINALNYSALQILDEKNRLNKSKELRRNENVYKRRTKGN